MSYRLSALAERDLDEIGSYVAEDASPDTAGSTTAIKATFGSRGFFMDGATNPPLGQNLANLEARTFSLRVHIRGGPARPAQNSELRARSDGTQVQNGGSRSLVTSLGMGARRCSRRPCDRWSVMV